MDTPSASSSAFNTGTEPTAPSSVTSNSISSEIQQAVDLAYAGIVSPTQAWT